MIGYNYKANNMFRFLVVLVLLIAQGISAIDDITSHRQERRKLQRSEPLATFLTTNCSDHQFQCENGKCINGDQVCDKIDSCGDGSDESFCQRKLSSCWPWQESCVNGRCGNETFRCNNGKCINVTSLCDQSDDCSDGTDEMRSVVGFKCPLGDGGDICVLPQRYVSDKITHCRNEEDESTRIGGDVRTFDCLDGLMTISDSQQCDGVVDCMDLSDECICEKRNEHLCSRMCTNEEQIGASNCSLGNFVCSDGVEVKARKVCDGIIDCPNGLDEKYCTINSTQKIIECPGDVHGKTTTLARVCDGRPECFDFSDECISDCAKNGSLLPAYCNLNITTVPYSFPCFTDVGTKNLTVRDLCNGKWSECSPRIEAEELDCAGRFYCTSGKLMSIDIALQCNGYAECDDGSDEANCTGSRFYCKDKNDELLSVPLSFLSDGVKDCKSGKDECPSLTGKPLASELYLIASPFFQVWIWIVALSCIVANGVIIISKINQISKIMKSRAVAKSNHFFIFNLAIADFLMGIYLLGISVKQSLVSGVYCQHDISWRSGGCPTLGALAVVSSEATVFMLFLLTTQRLISVHYPFKTRNMKFRWSILAVCLAWAVALFVGLFPLSSLAEGSFTYGAFIPSKYILGRNVKLRDVNKFASLLSIFTPNSTNFGPNHAWNEVHRYLQKYHPHHGIKGYFGYYSEFSMCMPNYYVTTREAMWGYSFSLILFNFLIFMYILAAYIAIYRKTAKKKVESTSDVSAKLQGKIARIISSDFACWMPVCIIAFLTLSGRIRETAWIYSLTATVILPINSVLNPFFYSDLCPKTWSAMKGFVEKLTKEQKKNKTSKCSSNGSDVTKV